MKNNKIAFAACSLLMTLASVSPTTQAKEWQSIQIATEGVYEPWNRTLPDGSFDGFEPQMAKVLCERMKIQCTIVAQDWDGLIPGLKAGKFDVIMDALAISAERRKVIDFSRPYTDAPATFIAQQASGIDLGAGNLVLRGDPALDTPVVEDLRNRLKGKLIGIVSGTVYSGFIREQFGQVATIREYKTPPEPLMDLKNGRVDVVFEDYGFLAGELQRGGASALVLVGPAISGPIWGEGQGFGIRPGEPELKAKLDAAIASMIADGTISELSHKWFRHDFTPAAR